MRKTYTLEEIKAKMARHYGGEGDNMSRELHVHLSRDDHGLVGSAYLSLDGSPPKGYAIAIAGYMGTPTEETVWRLNLYDLGGCRWKKNENCKIPELSQRAAEMNANR